MAPHLAKHREVIGIDAWTEDTALRAALEREGADNVKRVKTHALPPASFWLDDRRGAGHRLARAVPGDQERSGIPVGV